MTNGQRLALGATGLAMGLLAGGFSFLSWERADQLAGVISALVSVAALGVTLWAALAGPGGSSIRVSNTGTGYLLQVEAISAAAFADRGDELEDMAAFCAAEDIPGSEDPALSYWRWLAPAWAGKSALMAHFVLHPPPDIDIVSFFITARLARQNDRAAFCEVVQRQLYALIGEEEPMATAYGGDEQLRLALDRAARVSMEHRSRTGRLPRPSAHLGRLVAPAWLARAIA
ncbi:hypothetical protein [Streptomyces sp. NPDC006638]|uniref:hypothetical protein n=1 Tax=Streptomyces sp. NPDC006638 TaxID=3157183 RepID=UPI0033AE6E3B